MNGTPKDIDPASELREEDDENLYHLDDHPLRVGNYVTITEADGERYPFRVVSSIRNGVGGV